MEKKQLHDRIMKRVTKTEQSGVSDSKEKPPSIVRKKGFVVKQVQSVDDLSDIIYEVESHSYEHTGGIHHLVERERIGRGRPQESLFPHYARAYLPAHAGVVTRHDLYVEAGPHDHYHRLSLPSGLARDYETRVTFGEGMRAASMAEMDFKSTYAFREHPSHSLGAFQQQAAQYRSYDPRFQFSFASYYYAGGGHRYQPSGFAIFRPY